MRPSRFPLGALLAAVALLAASCGGEAVWPSTTGSSTTGPSTTEPATTTTSEPPTTTTTVTPTTTGNDAGDTPAAIQALVVAAEEIRGHRFLEPVEVTVLSTAELAERVRADMEEDLDLDEIAVEAALTRLLGILPTDVDLAAALTDLYAEQVGGFYDTDTGELVVAGAEDPSPLAQTIIIHELVHALDDQHFGLGDKLDELLDNKAYHQAAALQALAEGEATYFQIVFLQERLTPEQQMAAVAESMEVDTTVLDSLPGWLGEDLAFPYEWGFSFVEQLIENGGIVALDQAYEHLPTTVEQIMHPPAYLTFEPARPVTMAATSVEGYDVYEEGEFGEWNLSLYLLDGVTDGVATVAAAGWGGDAYRIHWDGSRVAFAYLFEGDSPRDAEELAPALVDSLAASMAVGDPQEDEESKITVLQGEAYAYIQKSGNQVLLVVADEAGAGQALVAALRLPIEEPE